MTITSNSTTQQSEIKLTRPRLVRLTIAACLLFWIFVFADSGWGPIIVPLSNQLQASLTVTGLFYVAWSTGYLPGALIGGAMLDRYGPRRVLFGASLIILCGFFTIYFGLLLPHAMPVIVLLAIAGLGGVGGGVIDASTNGLISAIYTKRRGMALNLFNLLYPLGGVLVALTDAVLLRLFHNDPRPCFIFTMCFTLCASISLLGIPTNYRIGGGTSTVHKGGSGRNKDSIITLVKILAPVILVMMFISGISSSVRTWTPAYLHVA